MTRRRDAQEPGIWNLLGTGALPGCFFRGVFQKRKGMYNIGYDSSFEIRGNTLGNDH